MTIVNDLLLQRASELKQQYHKDGTRADWYEIEEILHSEGYEIECDENFRCRVKSFEKKNGTLLRREEIRNKSLEDKMYQLELQKVGIKIEKTQVQNLKNQINKIIRETAKKDTIKEIIEKNMKIVANDSKRFKYEPIKQSEHRTAVLQLSDWHRGLSFSNFNNTYNTKIFNDRAFEVSCRAIDIAKKNNVKEVYVLLQGDFISSNIHNIIRLQNQEDVISQIINTSEAISNILLDLYAHFDLKVCLMTDNHSRVTANKDDNLENENYMRITEWYLKSKLKQLDGIEFLDSELGFEIAKFKVYDYNCCAVHGHNDKFNQIVKNMSLYTRDIYDYIFTSHLHHLHVEETNFTTVISNGSLSGVDDLSNKLRLSSSPMQMLTIFSKERGMEAMYPIKVK